MALAEIPKNSFKIVANSENSFSLYSNKKQINEFDTSLVRNYILFYKRVHFERQNYLINQTQVDSVRKTTPYYTITVTNQSGLENRVKCFRKGMIKEQYDLDGNLIEWDRDRLWLVLNDGSFVVAQYHVFDRLLLGLDYFQPHLQELNP